MIIVFDTETTGKVNFQATPDDLSQPRLVQLAAILQTDEGRTMQTLSTIIKPEGFTIPDEAAVVHGITTEIALRDGNDLMTALCLFSEMCYQADLHVAYNCEFDRIVMAAECERNFLDYPFKDSWADPMKAATPICKIPGRYGYKWPKLSEAYEFLFGLPMTGAHNALADVEATAKVYWELKKRGVM